MSAKDCFCGCGTKVKRRRVPYNLLGREISTELDGWAGIRRGFEQAGMDFGAEPFYEEGLRHQAELQELMHSGERSAALDLTRAGQWNQYSRKKRKKTEQLIDESVKEVMAREGQAEASQGGSDDESDETSASLAPVVMLAQLEDRMDEPIRDDVAQLIIACLQESVSGWSDLSEQATSLLALVAWAGYCTRSIAIDEMSEAREESPTTTSLFEYNLKETGEEPFSLAAAAAEELAGFGERPIDDPITMSTWVITPGVGEVDAMWELAEAGVTQVVQWFDAGTADYEPQSVDNGTLYSSWLLGYFLRAQEQYASVDEPLAGAAAWLSGPDPT